MSTRSLVGSGSGAALRALLIGAAALGVTLCGCIKVGAPKPPPRRVATPRPVTRPAPPPAPIKSDAYATFDQLRKDLLARSPHIGKVNCAFTIGVDVSGSAYATQVLEHTAKLLTDACRYFLAEGDRIAVIPWDSRIREKHVKAFDYTDSDDAISEINAAFEDLENLVDPESRGSNLLDARGHCMEDALSAQKDTGGALCPVVLIFTDIRMPDMDFARQKYSREKLVALRKKLAGSDTAEFAVKPYQATADAQVIVHTLVGGKDMGAAAHVNRTRSAGTAKLAAPTRPSTPPPPPPPRDTSGLRVLFIIAAMACVLALIGLPFAWRHRLKIGDAAETMRAFGGRVRIESGKGISPAGTVYLAVPGLEDRALLVIESKGPQLVARSTRGVRLNDGRTELAIPLGRPCTLRIAIDGVPGEQTLDLQASDFFSTNTGPIIGMIVALIVLVACVIG